VVEQTQRMSLAARRVQNPATRRDSSNDDPYLVRRSGRNKAPKRQLTRQICEDHLPRKLQAVGKKIKAATGKQQVFSWPYIVLFVLFDFYMSKMSNLFL
jgi:hypothetical protein